MRRKTRINNAKFFKLLNVLVLVYFVVVVMKV